MQNHLWTCYSVCELWHTSKFSCWKSKQSSHTMFSQDKWNCMHMYRPLIAATATTTLTIWQYWLCVCVSAKDFSSSWFTYLKYLFWLDKMNFRLRCMFLNSFEMHEPFKLHWICVNPSFMTSNYFFEQSLAIFAAYIWIDWLKFSQAHQSHLNNSLTIISHMKS